jgi:retron-type reverse transcriptase
LNSHIILNKILAKEQYGYRSNTSTEKAIVQLTNKILQALDNKEWVGGLFCDLSKAFDHVNHDILLEKLKFYGVTGTANKLIKSCLTNRYQRVKIKNNHILNHYSEWDNVKQGVPQGSVLGPLLFLIYINYLSDSISDISSPVLFADDTNFICTQQNFNIFNDEIETAFLRINKWLQVNTKL